MRVLSGFILFVLTAVFQANCQEETAANPQADVTMPRKSLPNIKTLTLGGKQFWTDHAWRKSWRIQKNAITGQWRLLDSQNVRQAWGSLAACEQKLDEYVPDVSLAERQVVVLLHGLIRSADSMNGLAGHLESRGEYVIVPFEYASTRGSVAQHAEALRHVVDGLPADSEVSFVGHSLGNIVVRHALGDWRAAGCQVTLDRIKQVVMLGPPNQGSALARLFSTSALFELVAGQSSQELGPKWESLQEKLATPDCPFGIIAGRTADAKLKKNPLLQGESDFVVSVEETKLYGAKEFMVVEGLHTFLMDHPDVRTAVANFLDHNSFD